MLEEAAHCIFQEIKYKILKLLKWQIRNEGWGLGVDTMAVVQAGQQSW